MLQDQYHKLYCKQFTKQQMNKQVQRLLEDMDLNKGMNF